MQPGEGARAEVTGAASQAVIASMRQHGVRFTAANYAVWHGYLSGENTAVRRTIEIVLSNGKTLTEQELERLYLRHFCPAQRSQQLRDLARFGLEKIEEACSLAQEAGNTAAIAACLDGLRQQLRVLLAGSQTLTDQLAQSQERIGLLENFLHDATREATTDSLTGLSNRRAFDHALRNLAAEAMNSGADLAFVLLDVDHFKMVNDHWGHPAGDEVLRQMAGTLTRTVRGGDLVARYGGEEFAVILPKTGRRGALAVAENMREAVAQQSFGINGGAENLSLTISAGISCYAPGESLASWQGRADVALYCAKNAGRNRVMFGTTNEMPTIVASRLSPALPIQLKL